MPASLVILFAALLIKVKCISSSKILLERQVKLQSEVKVKVK
jgi:hypothetical protein